MQRTLHFARSVHYSAVLSGLASNIRTSSLLLNGSTGITIRHVQGCARKPEATDAFTYTAT